MSTILSPFFEKGTVHSSCVQVSWLDLFICIHLHAVKRSCCWQLPEPTVFLDLGPILSAWLRGAVKCGEAGSQPDSWASARVSASEVPFGGLTSTHMTSECQRLMTGQEGRMCPSDSRFTDLIINLYRVIKFNFCSASKPKITWFINQQEIHSAKWLRIKAK